MVDQPEPRFSSDQLRRAARDRGLEISRRQITDWVSLGLLDKATPRGRGQAKGKSYTWSRAQRDLLLTLLVHQQQRDPPASRAMLTNIPVAVWLTWDDDLIPLRQVRRALQTWTGRYARTTWSRAEVSARAVLDQLDHPDADPADRQRLVDTIAHAGYQGSIDEPQLGALVARVFDPHGSGLTRGPLGIMDSESYTKIVAARTTALASLDTADATYLTARAHYRQIGASTDPQLIKLRSLAGTIAGLGTIRSFDQVVSNACIDLITVLGHVLRAERS